METTGKSIQRLRSFHRWSAEHVNYATVDEFLDGSIMPGKAVHSIHGEQLPLDIYTDLTSGRPLLVSFHGAIPEDVIPTLPVFSGHDLASALSTSLVAFSDPCLYLDPELRIGWFSGTERLRLQSLLPRLLKSLIQRSQPSKLIFLGGSAGGFAALLFSRAFPEALCLAWNPQTNLLAFDQQPVDDYCRVAFNLCTRKEIERYVGRFVTYDLTIENDCALAYTLYVQNMSDSHVCHHLKPLLRGLGCHLELDRSFYGAISDRFWLCLDDWGDGHIPPPRSFILSSLQGLIESNGRWADTLRSIGAPTFSSRSEA